MVKHNIIPAKEESIVDLDASLLLWRRGEDFRVVFHEEGKPAVRLDGDVGWQRPNRTH